MAVHGFCGAFEIQDMLQSPSPTLCLRIFKLTNPPHLWTDVRCQSGTQDPEAEYEP